MEKPNSALRVNRFRMIKVKHLMSSCSILAPWRCPQRWCQAGFSLLEVMIAVVFIAIATMGAMSHISTVEALRQDTKERSQAQRLASSIADRFLATPFNELRTAAHPWSYARPFPVFNQTGGVSTATVPAIGAPEANLSLQPMTMNDLVVQGLVPRFFDAQGTPSAAGTDLQGVQVFIEFYRAVTRFSSAPQPGFRSTSANIEVVNGIQSLGLLCEANPSKPNRPADFTAIFQSPTSKNLYYIRDQTPDQVADGVDGGGVDHSYDPVLVRVVVRWVPASERNSSNQMMQYGTSSSGDRPVTLVSGERVRRGQVLELWTAIRPGA